MWVLVFLDPIFIYVCAHRIVINYLILFSLISLFLFFFFFNDTATTEIYTLSLHDALPILLYRHKGEITSNDILIISPNKVFADYISNVLPELGEEKIEECGFEELMLKILDNKYKIQTF